MSWDTIYTPDPADPASLRVSKLSKREHEVVIYACKGMTNKEIATFLELSFRTIEVHRRHAMTKLGAKSSAEMARIYIEGVTGAVLP